MPTVPTYSEPVNVATQSTTGSAQGPAWLRLGQRFEVGAGPSRHAAMEGVRGLAVLMVFLVHFHGAFSHLVASNRGHMAVSGFLAEIGHCGVDIFFVLSGYLIYSATLKPGLSLAPLLVAAFSGACIPPSWWCSSSTCCCRPSSLNARKCPKVLWIGSDSSRATC